MNRASENDEIGLNRKRISPGISLLSSDCNTLLSQQRKNRQIPSTLAPIDAVDRYTDMEQGTELVSECEEPRPLLVYRRRRRNNQA